MTNVTNVAGCESSTWFFWAGNLAVVMFYVVKQQPAAFILSSMPTVTTWSSLLNISSATIPLSTICMKVIRLGNILLKTVFAQVHLADIVVPSPSSCILSSPSTLSSVASCHSWWKILLVKYVHDVICGYFLIHKALYNGSNHCLFYMFLCLFLFLPLEVSVYRGFQNWFSPQSAVWFQDGISFQFV